MLVSIEWRSGETVPARYLEGDRRPGMLLAHGAGAGQDHEFMVELQARLAGKGFPVLTFDYPYRAAGRRLPDRKEVLLESQRAAAGWLRERVGEIVLAGKSMGGRMASYLAAEGEACVGVVCYGYPLLPVGKTQPRDVTHLGKLQVPILFISGSRDSMAPLPLLQRAAAGVPMAWLVIVPAADHSFRVKGRDAGSVQQELVDATVNWLIILGGGPLSDQG